MRIPEKKSCTSVPPVVLDRAQQVENSFIVVDAHAVLRRILAVHQLRKRHMKRFAEPLNDAVIGHTLSVLPLGDGLVGHAELLRQLLLREVLFPALARDVAADGCLVHSECLLR